MPPSLVPAPPTMSPSLQPPSPSKKASMNSSMSMDTMCSLDTVSAGSWERGERRGGGAGLVEGAGQQCRCSS
jgi:hypothetical protein